MPGCILVNRLSYGDLHTESERFLSEYHPSRNIPIPIEEIIEFRFRMDIVPVPNLLRSEEIDGCLSKDQTTIYVDENVYENYLNRYRFSLAHELSHRILHQYLYEAFDFTSVTEWKTVIHGMSEAQRRWFEWQAYALAGLILVPGRELTVRFNDALDRLAAYGMTLADAPEAAKDSITDYLARQFQVSTAVMQKRLYYDKCWDSN